MRKILTICAGILVSASLFAGGLVTNTNQSAMFTRLQNRNASTGIDAVYYNPAGVTKLGEGFFVSLNNQVISQTQTITNSYPYISGAPKTYVGDVSAPLFPGVYVAYNTGNLSFSAGVNPIGGGGGATYKKGLPSFETNIANLVPMVASSGIPVSQYSSDIYFKGTSVYMGYQANVAYKVSDQLSVAAGIRFVTAKDTYKGFLKNISINPTYPAFGAQYTGGMVLASDFFTSGATTLNTLAAGATAYVAGLQPIITAGAGATPLSSGTAVGLSAAQVGQIQQIIGAAGQNPAGLTIAQAQAILNAAAPGFASKANTLTGNAAATQDINVDAEETGSGIAPILSVNYSPADNLNISLRYEFKTELNLTTKVINNQGGGIFVQGTKVIADIPAMLSVGAEFKPTKKLMLAGSFDYYFDKNVDYDGSADKSINMINHNFLEFGLGAEYSLTDKFRVSAGWVATKTGVDPMTYNNDQSYSTNTNSFGAGFGYRITPMIDLNVGGQYTFYADGKNNYPANLANGILHDYTETYAKKTWLIGIGLDFFFGK